MYQVIAVDLDGTLLSSENKITKYTKEIIRLLTKKNFYFILASGRHHIDVIKIRDSLNIKTFMITSNGSEIYNLDNKLISNDYLEKNIAKTLCEIEYSNSEIITQIYQNNQWYINSNNIDNKFCSAFSSLKYQYFHPNFLTYTNISKIFFTSKNIQKLYSLEKKIINFYKEKVNINFSIPSCLEIVSGKTSKGYGLKLISDLLKIPLNNFLAFGDGMNDQDMLDIVGKAYIMKNADSRLKDALPHVKIIESNNNDGVAKCLKKFL